MTRSKSADALANLAVDNDLPPQVIPKRKAPGAHQQNLEELKNQLVALQQNHESKAGIDKKGDLMDIDASESGPVSPLPPHLSSSAKALAKVKRDADDDVEVLRRELEQTRRELLLTA